MYEMLVNPIIVYIWAVVVVVALLAGGSLRAVSFHRNNSGSMFYKPYRHAAVWGLFASTLFSLGILLPSLEALHGEGTLITRSLMFLFFFGFIVMFEQLIFYLAKKREPCIQFESWKVWK